MKKKQALPVYLDEVEKEKIKKIAKLWGVSMSSAIKRLIREAKLDKC